VGFVEGETGYSSETCVKCDVGGTGEVSIKVEDPIDIKEEVSIKFEAVYIKDETPETTTCAQTKTEHEVRLLSVCEIVTSHALRQLLPQKGNSDVILYYLLLCVKLCVPYTS
jgi:hypothetical protein